MSLFAVAKSGYCQSGFVIAQLFTFPGFYTLSMVYRKNAARHMQYFIRSGLC